MHRGHRAPHDGEGEGAAEDPLLHDHHAGDSGGDEDVLRFLEGDNRAAAGVSAVVV